MPMDKPEACPNCLTRLHPLEVSDLYRGRKLDCHVCGYRLKAVATGAWATVAAVLAGFVPWLLSRLLQHESFFAEILIVAAAATLVWLAPPGLIAGAPWVSIKAEAPALMGVKRRRENIKRQQRQRSVPEGSSDE
ncbi:MAG: hypothetical protein WD397_08030 [Wenzhouxiangellaceae bacterium]